MRTFGASTTISSVSPRSSMFYCGGHDENQEPHFLDACSLCSKPLFNSDIYMYRGNTPFCSKECRQEQIDLNEACERQKRKLSSSSKAAARSSVSKSDRKNGTVVVA